MRRLSSLTPPSSRTLRDFTSGSVLAADGSPLLSCVAFLLKNFISSNYFFEYINCKEIAVEFQTLSDIIASAKCRRGQAYTKAASYPAAE